MCGRYVNVASTHDLVAELDVEDVVDDDLAPSWNVAPTDPVRIVLDRTGGDGARRQLRTASWGLVPGWSEVRTGGAKMINARSETVTTKPAFRAAAARRRCLVPALGYYEWRRTGGSTTPYFLHRPDDRLLTMAGLYELWRDPARADDDPQRWLWTCAVITRPATDSLGAIHDRCPVLVPAELRARWLDCTGGSSGGVEVARRLLDELPEPHLVPRAVGRAVGNVRNDGPELIAPAEPAQRLF